MRLRARRLLLPTAGALLALALPGTAWAPPLPAPTFTDTPPTVTNKATTSFSFTGAPETDHFTCSVDDAAQTDPCPSPQSVGPLADGSHTFRVWAVDTGGEASDPASFAWTIDTTAPTVTITSQPSSPTSQTTASFGFSSDDGAATFECSQDGSGFEACSSPKTYTSLPDGPHTFDVRAVDAASNRSSPAHAAWTIDTAGPSTTITSSPPTPTNQTTATFSFTTSGVRSVCTLDGTSEECSSPRSYTGVGAGDHHFQVQSFDSLGNAGPAAHASWTVDLTAPTTTITSGPAGTVRDASATFQFTATEPSSFQCSLDNASFTGCSSPHSYGSLADGSHTFRVRATDRAGNTGGADSATWVVDTTGPVISGTAPVTAEAQSAQGAVVAYPTPTAVDAVGSVSCTPSSGSTFPLGATTVTCKATDALGNVGSAQFSVTVRDTTPPRLTLPDAASITSNVPLAATEPAPAAFLAAATARDLVDGTVTVSSDAPATFPLGATIVTFSAVDAAGNVAKGKSTITIAPPGAPAAPPTPQATSSPAGVAAAPPAAHDLTPPGEVKALTARAGDHSVTLTWKLPLAADFDHVTVTRRRVGAGAAVTVYTGAGTSFVDHRLVNGTAYRYLVVALDRAGNGSRGATVTASPRLIRLVQPQNGARVTSPPRLAWIRIARADYYNVQVFRGSTKILSAWPGAARLTLTKSWQFDGRTYRLTPGTYRWYVWPGYGPHKAKRYGALFGQSTFVVVKPAR